MEPCNRLCRITFDCVCNSARMLDVGLTRFIKLAFVSSVRNGFRELGLCNGHFIPPKA